MADLCVIGNSEFVMGFELIGVKSFEAETGDKLSEIYVKALSDPSIGIIVTNQASLNKVGNTLKKKIINSISPVTVVLSTEEGGQDNIREMIKKAIGIDLLGK